ncbi:uncharacterized protein LOC100823143 [Brachypodium distachyon]|uniref:Uncharacterized protein n=1 Tax=Brachypodium distachyon TaxID=15368 RepID=I1HUB8_BRADI|nr:uncharacterized protein LOC100823143 [Brachypodium distachyon]KQK11073.1 hypothetical protein BRADI_2g57946v3 [Brachypodium distachyon]|eukprot:XP_003564864.1 uncharacterized protein LOC100823143 [Brachypodium distachyon]
MEPMASMTGVACVFNILSVIIDVMPLFVICFVTTWDSILEYFSLRSFLLGALSNLVLACHVLFILEEAHHQDVLYISVVGLCFGTMFSLLCLLHKVVLHKDSHHVRYWMLGLLVILLIGSSIILYGIDGHLHISEVSVFGKFIYASAIATVTLLNGLPILVAIVSLINTPFGAIQLVVFLHKMFSSSSGTCQHTGRSE